MKLKRSIFILLLLGINSWCAGQKVLSLTECRRLAIQNNRLMKIAEKTVTQASYNRKAYETNNLPKFSLNGYYLYTQKDIDMNIKGGYLPVYKTNSTTGKLEPDLYINPVSKQPVIGTDGNPIFNSYAYFPGLDLSLGLHGVYTAGVSVEQPIYMGGKISTSIEMAQIGEKLAQSNVQLEKSQIIYKADEAYWRYVSLKEKKKLAEKYDSMLIVLERKVDDACRVKMASRTDLLKVKVKHNEAELELQKAQNGLELSRMALCQVIGVNFNTPIAASDTTVSIDQTILKAKYQTSDRPEMRLLENSVSLKEKEVKLVQADFLPQVGVGASYNFTGGVKLNGEGYNNNDVMLLASVKIPLFHWSEGKQKMQAARIEAEKTQLQLDHNRELMELELQQTLFDLDNAYTRVKLANSSLTEAIENLKVNDDSYRVGMTPLTDRLEAQVEWQKAYSDLIDAKVDAKLKETAVLKASGKL